MQDNVVYIILWIIIFITAIIIFKTNKKTKIYWDKFIIKLPIFWPLIKKKILAMYAWNLWILLERWIIINQALKISSQTLENDFYEKEIKKIISWISTWKELSDLMWINEISSWKENPYFPIELSSVVKIWEQTWKLPELLLKISNKFKKEIDNIVKNLATAIEPLVIVWVWIIVWILIMAIMLPFFNMVNVV
jgi:type II secretory pathway component PulF